MKGIKLSKGDHVVGMVVADPEMDLLSICENGYGKRTPFGYEEPIVVVETPVATEEGAEDDAPVDEPPVAEEPEEVEGEGEDAQKSSMRYRRQRRGGKGLVNIKTTARNGKVVDIIGVSEQDEVLMVTSQGKIQRIRVRDINQIGRGTQGVTIIRMEEGDTVASIARVPSEDITVVTPAEVLTAPTTPVAEMPQPEIEMPDVETLEEETDDN